MRAWPLFTSHSHHILRASKRRLNFALNLLPPGTRTVDPCETSGRLGAVSTDSRLFKKQLIHTWVKITTTMTALSEKSAVGLDSALPDGKNKDGTRPEGSTKSLTINPRLFQLDYFQMLPRMKGRCVLQSLGAVKCCFLYVPTLAELSRSLLNEGIYYSRRPTGVAGAGSLWKCLHNALL